MTHIRIPVPKIFDWPRKIDQHYECDFDLLITGGCSFTATTTCLDSPLSWPGIVKDRCNIPVCIDLSFPGAGNEYIANSVLATVEDQISQNQHKKILVLISWSGLDRTETLTNQIDEGSPRLDNITYKRTNYSVHPTNPEIKPGEIWRSWKNIVFTKNYLENKKIAHGFVSYCNLFEPPFLPRCDRTPEWPGNISQQRLNVLQQMPWTIPHTQSMFEFCFSRDFLAEDLFHPNQNGVETWTNEILLPNLQKQGLIRALSQG